MVNRPVRRVGPYELLQRIGKGGMAEVWMGRRTAIGGVSKVVAVKLPTGQVADDPRLRAMFIKEAELSMLLSHSTVVQVFDAGEHEGRPFMVMEWVDGMNLAQLGKSLAASGKWLSLPAVAFVIGEVLRALAYAHTITHEGAPLGVVHRDVSPQNVLVSVSGEVKLTDFGVARVASEDTSGLHAKGKLRYMAPEQLAGQSGHPRVDLYAVGAILHELMDRRKFRDSKDEAHLYGMVLSGEIPPLQNPDVPRELDELRRALLRKDVDARVDSAELALELLMRWPGYANASIELGRTCRSVMGVAAPRSGIYSTPGAAVSAMSAGPSGPALPARDSEIPTLTAPRQPAGADDRAAITATMPARTPVPASRPAAARAERVGIGLAVGLGVLLAAGAGTGIWRWRVNAPVAEGEVALERPPGAAQAAAAGMAPEETREAAVEVAAAGMPTAGPPTEPEPEPELKDPTPEAPEIEAEGPSELDGDPATDSVTGGEAPASTPDPEPTPKPVAPVGKADVTFKASQFDFVYIKVGRKKLVLEPNAKAKIPAGKHVVSLRTKPTESWKRAGTLEVDANHTYEVRMTRPGGFTVERWR